MKSTAVLKIIGFTARQIQDEFCHKGKGKRRGSMDRDTLDDFLSRFSSEEVDFILREVVLALVKHRLIRGRTYTFLRNQGPVLRDRQGLCGENEKQGGKAGRSVKGRARRQLLHDKGGWTTEKTIKVNMLALTKFFQVMGRERTLWERLKLTEVPILIKKKHSGQALQFTNPERVIEKLKKPEFKAIGRIVYGCGERIDDVPRSLIHSWKRREPLERS